jgi:hypothetical protein
MSEVQERWNLILQEHYCLKRTEISVLQFRWNFNIEISVVLLSLVPGDGSMEKAETCSTFWTLKRTCKAVVIDGLLFCLPVRPAQRAIQPQDMLRTAFEEIPCQDVRTKVGRTVSIFINIEDIKVCFHKATLRKDLVWKLRTPVRSPFLHSCIILMRSIVNYFSTLAVGEIQC